MARHARLYLSFFSIQMRLLLEYRASFLIGLVAQFLIQGATLATLWVVMQQVPALNGWTLPELLLIYGLTIFCRSFSHMFADNTWRVGGAIRHGSFDRYLVRPVDPLFHLLADDFSIDGLGNFIIGGTIVLSTGQALGVFASFLNIAYLVLAIASGALIFFALNLITCSSAFWIIDSIPVSGAVFENYMFAQYPLSIYPRAIEFMLTWIIPYGFASYYPASFVLGHDVGPVVWLGPLMGAVLLVIGWRLWGIGLRRYEGTGS
jgi:ABC-2 type transport system permease protein